MLLVWQNALLVLDLHLDIVNHIGGLNLKGDSPGSEGLNEDLHTAMEMEDKVEGGLLLDVVVQKDTPTFELFASKDGPGECCVACQWTNSPTNHLLLQSVGTLKFFKVPANMYNDRLQCIDDNDDSHDR